MLYLYGASGYAKVIIDIVKSNNIHLEGLYDDNILNKELLGYPILSSQDISSSVDLFISIGDNKSRKEIAKKVKAHYITLVHPSAILSPTIKLGNGTAIMQGAVVQAGSKIGNHVILNTSVSIDHENIISDYVHISPHSTLCGNVHIGEGTWIGAGSVILPGIKIGKWSVIGAGSVVDIDIPDYCLAIGNRCKVVKYFK